MGPAELTPRPRSAALGKHLVRLIAGALVLPLVAGYRLSTAVWPGRKGSIFQGYSQLLSLIPGNTGNLLRSAFYRRVLARCSDSCIIGFGTIFSTAEAEIGANVYIGARCMIGWVSIGDDVLLGSNVDLLSGKHQHNYDRLDLPIRLQGGTYDQIRIGRDSWIGNGATVAANVGSQAVIAACAVVVKPVPGRAIMGGNPARMLGERGARPHVPGNIPQPSTSDS